MPAPAPRCVDDLEVPALQVIDRGNEVLVGANEDGGIVATFPGESEQIGNDPRIDCLFGGGAKRCCTIGAGGLVATADPAVNRSCTPVPLGREDPDAGLPVEKPLEKLFEIGLATRFVSSVYTRLFERCARQADARQNAVGPVLNTEPSWVQSQGTPPPRSFHVNWKFQKSTNTRTRTEKNTRRTGRRGANIRIKRGSIRGRHDRSVNRQPTRVNTAP